ncbi:MAG: hypothetical protein AAB638_04050 [Patescibacteria group bacterium]
MAFAEHKIIWIDEYILLKNKGNEFLALIEQYFRDKKLTFSLLEMVLLNEKGIGETYIYAYKDFDSKTFYNKYIELVTKFKEDFKGGVSSYSEWYEKNTWILVGTGTGTVTSYNLSNYNWVGEFEPKPIKKYGQQNGLTKEIIENYFNSYAHSIADLELGKHPNYFIVIHPVSKSHNDTIVPYGNLYLHFATIDEVSLETVKDFLREFMVIWYKSYGGHNLKAAVKRLVEKVLSNKEVSDFLPKDFGTHKGKLEVAFMEYFFAKDSLQKFKAKVEEFKAKLAELTNLENQDITESKVPVKCYLTAPSYTDLLNNFSNEGFESFIFKRALAIYLLFCKKLTVDETKKLLQKKESKANDLASQLAYFNQYFHLYFLLYEDRKASVSYETELRGKYEVYSKFSEFELNIIKEFQQKS